MSSWKRQVGQNRVFYISNRRSRTRDVDTFAFWMPDVWSTWHDAMTTHDHRKDGFDDAIPTESDDSSEEEAANLCIGFMLCKLQLGRRKYSFSDAQVDLGDCVRGLDRCKCQRLSSCDLCRASLSLLLGSWRSVGSFKLVWACCNPMPKSCPESWPSKHVKGRGGWEASFLVLIYVDLMFWVDAEPAQDKDSTWHDKIPERPGGHAVFCLSLAQGGPWECCNRKTWDTWTEQGKHVSCVWQKLNMHKW